eukprot:c32049_g1_i1 orf=103-357(+)
MLTIWGDWLLLNVDLRCRMHFELLERRCNLDKQSGCNHIIFPAEKCISCGTTKLQTLANPTHKHVKVSSKEKTRLSNLCHFFFF